MSLNEEQNLKNNDLSKLIKNRAIIKGQLTRFKNVLSTFPEKEIDIEQIKLRLHKIENLWVEFERIQTNIELIDDMEGQTREREQFEDAYFEIVCLANQYINESSSVQTSVNTVASKNGESYANIKLPTISLPTFNGQYDQWFQFRDTFNALIHSNDNLSDVQKFFYLKSALQNDAAKVIDSLEVSNTNYKLAWDLLKQRFENDRLVINSHVKALFELPTVNKESQFSLRQLLDNFNKHLRALKALGQPTGTWDTLLIYLMANKLDPVTHREWEWATNSTKLPTTDDLISFLSKRSQLLEVLDNDKSKFTNQNRTNTFSNKKSNYAQHTHINIQNHACQLCKGSHFLYQCNQFLNLPVSSRIEHVKRFNLCTNCLRTGHSNSNCHSKNCYVCNKRHNTKLHLPDNTNPSSNKPNQRSTDNTRSSTNSSQLSDSENRNKTDTVPQSSISTHCTQHNFPTYILLSTAIVDVYDVHDNIHPGRVLLDSGSQSNFITTEFAKKLNLPLRKLDIPIIGINQSLSHVFQKTNCTLKSRTNSFTQNLSFLVINKITDNLPSYPVNRSTLNIPENIRLADPTFHETNKIDLLIGDNIFWQLICVGQIKINNSNPILQKTKLGWIISGPIPTNNKPNAIACTLSTVSDLESQLERFWQVDEFNSKIQITSEEEKCENHFVSNTHRDETGRFVVSLPFRDNVPPLGDSIQGALKRFQYLENKFKKQPQLKIDFSKFMLEYETLGHMSETNSQFITENTFYYLPHHCVIRESSSTTKLRVVFDASAKTTSNVSLNDQLLVGPTVQRELYTIILKFRTYRYVIAADICKMYRQINVSPNDRNFQLIFWRYNENEPMKTYQLNTVTYGTASAPFLATRCLQQLGFNCQSSDPDISNIILNDFYVDDLLTGTDSLEHAKRIKSELTRILKSGGFELRKWLSNNSSVIENSNPHESVNINLDKESISKPLGLIWNAVSDTLTYDSRSLNLQNNHTTKRSLLSTISKIFDPLGLIGPITVKGKIIIQKLWTLKLDWDDPLPYDLHASWNNYFNQMLLLDNLRIPRHALCINPCNIELHGFCDASEAAYGGCIYLRTTDQTGHHVTNLLCSKSRVAPLKNISLPRLELCGAVLLVNLTDKVLNSIESRINSRHFWCDSTIVLSWLAVEPNSWKTFVANRVSEIHKFSQPSEWHYVNTKNNPADLISRGSTPTDLLKGSIWWHGPDWLANDTESWPIKPLVKQSDIPEKRTVKITTLINTLEEFDICDKFSTLVKLKRIVAYCIRFKNNCLRTTKSTGPLTVEEIEYAMNLLLRIAQSQKFSEELHCLKSKKPLKNRSKLLSLNPFLDQNNLIRVGGRISQSSINYDKKHPIVLPCKHALTKLIIEDAHKRNLHAGIQTSLAHVRCHYWPLNGKAAVKRILRNCTICFRANPVKAKYFMGNLPESRVTPYRPFLVSGVDYGGPFLIKDGQTRTRKTIKAYICIFVCFSSKAVHIELATDLSTESFLNVLKRFFSRRGHCTDIYSDNATNFVGTNKKLTEISNYFSKIENRNAIIDYCSQRSIKWHFIPPRSPHFGGIWEAAIKSAKTLLTKTIGTNILSFEQFYTILTQIEAALNSRPLMPLTPDPSDLDALTPGHFLIGEALTAIPQTDVTEIPTNRLSNYNHLQQMFQHFWKRWSQEYITHLQQRTKWTQHEPSIEIGMLVLIRDESTPPLKWPLGRIIEVYPGTDNVIRVATVQTATGTFKRSVRKLCILPINATSRS